jgi:hypothetical protein
MNEFEKLCLDEKFSNAKLDNNNTEIFTIGIYPKEV